MQIIFSEAELVELLKKQFPKELMPEGSVLTKISMDGYSYDRKLTVTLEKKSED